MIWFWCSAILTVFYVSLVLAYTIGWLKLPVWKKSGNEPKTFVTVIVPARNEESNIEKCINSILNQDYPLPLYEIIVVDDHSTDRTASIVENMDAENLQVIHLQEIEKPENLIAFKKFAIKTAIEKAKGTLIFTTDADCELLSTCLSTVVDYYEQNDVKFITGPVVFNENDKSLLKKIFALEFIGMMGVTGASNFWKISNMSNGANLAYEKAAYFAVDGFTGIDHIASGDDLLLMEKIDKKYPGKIAFLKSPEVVVKTDPPENMTEFFHQRIRWASKSRFYSDWKIIFFLALVWIFHINILWITMLLMLDYPQFRLWICGQLVCKLLADFLFLRVSSDFFCRKHLLWIFIPAEIFQFFYILVIGFLGNFRSYNWKGRIVK